MNLSHIHVFSEVADSGSISEASRRLECNRSRLSMAIKALEKDLGADLFERTGNNISLTEIGKAVYRESENILASERRIRQICSQSTENFNAEVWIARDDSLPNDLWQELVFSLNKMYPATSFNFVISSSGDLANVVLNRQVDYAFGIDYERMEDPELYFQPIGKIRMMSVCRSQHPLARKHRVTNEELRKSMQASLAYLNEKDNPELQPFSNQYLGISSFASILTTILQRDAWGVLPEPLIRDYLRKEKLKVIKHIYGLTQEDFTLISISGANEHPGISWLMDKLSDYLFDM